MRQDLPELENNITSCTDSLATEGMPMLDYVLLRYPPGTRYRMPPEDLFKQVVDKLLKFKKYHRKKQFKFADLLQYLRENQKTDE